MRIISGVQALSARLDALQGRSGPTARMRPFLALQVRHTAEPGHVAAAMSLSGMRVERLPGEAQDAFTERAAHETGEWFLLPIFAGEQ